MNPGGRADGRIIVVAGSSGSGKSAWVKQQLRQHRRVLAWDPEAEYAHEPGFVAIASPRALLDTLRKKTTQPGRYCFVPSSLSRFDWFCRLAFAWSRAAPCAVVAEETADVTTPNKAPQWYGTLIRRGRKWGLTLYGVTQRPAESDKTIIGNAHVIHCGRMQRAQDRKYMAAELDVSAERVARLQPLEWIERGPGGEITTGKLKFPVRKTVTQPRAKTSATVAQPHEKNRGERIALDWWNDF